MMFPQFKKQFQDHQISKTIQMERKFQNESKLEQKKFPCNLNTKQYNLIKFPFERLPNSGNYDFLSKYIIHSSVRNEVNESNKLKTYSISSSYLTSLLMTQNGQKFPNVDNEYVSQVQDVQVCVMENPPPLIISEHKQPPPQTKYDDNVNILPTINAINNTLLNKMGYFKENLEHIENAIVALFEKIRNSLIKNYNNNNNNTDKYENENYSISTSNNYNNNNGDYRFVLTPTMSATSVRDIKRMNKNYNNNDLQNENICNHLCDRQIGQNVECSDVRDTLAETVDYGAKKEETTNSTGSFLEKNEIQAFPISHNPKSFNESISLKNYAKVSNLLPEYKVFPVNILNNSGINNLKFDSIGKTDIQIKLKSFKNNETLPEKCNNKLTHEKVNEMTIYNLVDNELENTNVQGHLQSNKALIDADNILCNDSGIYEMKFEMNKIKADLPSMGSESRSLGKHENRIKSNENANYGRNIGSNSTRRSSRDYNNLTPALSAFRNHKDDSYMTKSSLKSENIHSPVNTHSPQDTITNRSVLATPILNNIIANRSAPNFPKNTNNITDIVSNRHPSLSSLRNTQSTSLLSVDLSRYNPPLTTNQLEQKTPISRTVSIGSSVNDVLPERTRLRRQRRLKSQNSQDETEDPIERLNRLKAQISASISEVKGVLKQYSNEGENDNNNIAMTMPVTSKGTKEVEEKKEDGPVTLRFVKKIYRRSTFSEEEEQCKKENNIIENKSEETVKPSEEIDKDMKLEIEEKTEDLKEVQHHNEEEKREQCQNIFDNVEIYNNNTENKHQDEKIIENLYNLKEEIQGSVDEIPQNEANEEPKEKLKTIKEDDDNKEKTQKTKEENTEAISSETIKLENIPLDNNVTHDTETKTKKKIIIKSKNPSRRASLAAVEGSKIEPPVKLAIHAKINRRPSDSGAIVNKKLITAKTSISGTVEEVIPKPQILKVKRPSIKSNIGQLATAQTKLIEKTTMTAANNKSNDHVKSTDDHKSIFTDKNKDVLMPNEPETKKQQINTEVTSQINLLLPTQLVIDEEASLNTKTIENAVFLSKQEQDQQQPQQATINSTTTKLTSNEIQKTDGGAAMLENLTTILNSTKTIETSDHQIKCENTQQEDLHDLLQQETTIIKPAATKQNQVKDQKLKDLLLKQASTEKFHDNSKNLQTTLDTVNKKQQQTSLDQQQVVVTTDVVVIKNDDTSNNNAHKDVEDINSLKKPCVDTTSTSAHIVAHQRKLEHNHHHHHHHRLFVEDERSTTNKTDTKTTSSPYISISSTSDSTQKTTSAESSVETVAEKAKQNTNTMPELQLAPVPVQTAEISPYLDNHKNNVIDFPKVEENKKETEEIKVDTPSEVPNRTTESPVKDESSEDFSESTEISETSTSLGSEETVATTEKPKKERKVKKKVIIKRQKRRLSIGDNFFHPTVEEEAENGETEILEKPIAYVSDDETDEDNKEDEEAKRIIEGEETNKPLKSCIMHKEYNIGDEVLYAERFKKTQIKWRRGRIKERITSISYLLDIDGKDVSSHINYLKKFTRRKVRFTSKEYLEIDYEQLIEDEETAEKLQKRTYSIWNMV